MQPIRPSYADAIAQRSQTVLAGRTASSATRVVIVEDSRIILDRLNEMLGQIPNVEVAGEVETEMDAIALLRHMRWDVVVLDLQLKIGTGLGVLKALRDSGPASGGKIIVFTNFAFSQYRDRCFDLGADYFCDKSREFALVGELVAGVAATKSGNNLP
ncbi:MAG: response regulator [Betaproteobacteria bacterium]